MYLGVTWFVPCRRIVPMSCSKMWCAVSPVSSDLSATLRTAASAAGSLVLTPGGCRRKRKERSSTSGFSGNVGNSERCWSRRRTCNNFTYTVNLIQFDQLIFFLTFEEFNSGARFWWKKLLLRMLLWKLLWKLLWNKRVARIEPHRLGYSSDIVPRPMMLLKHWIMHVQL